MGDTRYKAMLQEQKQVTLLDKIATYGMLTINEADF